MSKKDSFVAFVENAIAEKGENLTPEELEAVEFFNVWKGESGKTEGPAFTENGLLILKGMQEHKDDFGNMFKSKDLADAIGLSSRTVSGAIRKLVTDGYVEKVGANPVIYSLTAEGTEIDLSEM